MRQDTTVVRSLGANQTRSGDQVDTTKDTTTGIRVREIRIGEFDLPGVLVELSGELDVHDLESLREAMNGALSSELPTYVDLSGVTFLDGMCTRELAARYRLYSIYDRLLALRAPSWQAEASFRACGFGYLVGSYLDGEQFYPLEARKGAEEKHGKALALAV